MVQPRNLKDEGDANIVYVNPQKEVNLGLWMLFGAASVFLAARVWCKLTRRYGLWWDDWILLASWLILAVNDSLISLEYATGYVGSWDDRMRILITITSSATLVGQAWTKSAFGMTLVRITNGWKKWFVWFCIVTMNMYMVAKVIIQWAKVCNNKIYDVWYRLDFCVMSDWRDNFKEGGNVYNILMDFFFALFPWLVTWKLSLRRQEKIALCLTMSLGIVVAIYTAIRTVWKADGNKHDSYYYWRNGMSNIWYSAEITGTIIVQCIPVLRPFLREMHVAMTSKKLLSDKAFEVQSGYKSRSSWASRQTSSSRQTFLNCNNAHGHHDVKAVSVMEVYQMPSVPEEEADLEMLQHQLPRSSAPAGHLPQLSDSSSEGSAETIAGTCANAPFAITD